MPKAKKKGNRKFSAKYLTYLLAVMGSMVAGILASSVVFGLTELKSIAYAVILILTLAATTMVMIGVGREPTKVETLKNSLTKAYCAAIDASPLNPKPTSEEKR